ncbi:Transcription factor bye1 [Elasticomyces elasticus]|nr:Transcription factor bye1 [Elasticomyces elasticus]
MPSQEPAITSPTKHVMETRHAATRRPVEPSDMSSSSGVDHAGNNPADYDGASDSSNASTLNEEEDWEKDPYGCICGKTGHMDDGRSTVRCTACCKWQHLGCLYLPTYADNIPEDFICPACQPEAYPELCAAASSENKLWEHNSRKHEILELLAQKYVDWFWALYCRLSENNIRAMKNGRKLNGKTKKVKPEYQGRAEASARILLNQLDQAEVSVLHSKLIGRSPTRSEVYNALFAEAGRVQGYGQELGVLAELFGWVEKGSTV